MRNQKKNFNWPNRLVLLVVLAGCLRGALGACRIGPAPGSLLYRENQQINWVNSVWINVSRALHNVVGDSVTIWRLIENNVGVPAW